MKSPARILLALSAALAGAPVAVTNEAGKLPIVAQDLKQLEVSGKVVAALWTRRTGNFTLQLVYPDQGRGSYFTGNTIIELRRLDPTFGTRTLSLISAQGAQNDSVKPADTRAPSDTRAPTYTRAPVEPGQWKAPVIQAWLLRPDGTIIMPLSTSTPSFGPQDTIARERLFTFPLAASREASAVAVNIDGEYRIQKLERFQD